MTGEDKRHETRIRSESEAEQAARVSWGRRETE